jgi:putative thioredoxin
MQQPDPSDLSYDVTEADFEAAVLEPSMQVPVLLDCWAPWCGPCRSLGPVLEKLVQAYGGRFLLAKLNTDEAPQISAALQIRSIPLVVLFIGGRPVDQFTGALPEGQIRAFLDKHLPAGVAGGAEGAEGAEGVSVDALRAQAAEAPDHETALGLLSQALALEPEHPEANLDMAEHLIALREYDQALGLLDTLPATATGPRHTALRARIELAANQPPGDATALAARIQANPKDFEARFQLAALQAWAGDFGAAFEQLLDVVMRDKAEGKPDREKARLQLIAWFEVCPDPVAVSKGRRYLGMYLN